MKKRLVLTFIHIGQWVYQPDIRRNKVDWKETIIVEWHRRTNAGDDTSTPLCGYVWWRLSSHITTDDQLYNNYSCSFLWCVGLRAFWVNYQYMSVRHDKWRGLRTPFTGYRFISDIHDMLTLWLEMWLRQLGVPTGNFYTFGLFISA